LPSSSQSSEHMQSRSLLWLEGLMHTSNSLNGITP